MKKTILKFIKSPAFDFILFVFILVALFVLYGIYCIHAAADTFYNSDGYLVAQSSGYNSNVDYTISYPSDIPVIGDGASVPSGYNLIATAIYTDEGNRCRKYWIYYPSSVDPPTVSNFSTPPNYNYRFSAASGSQFYVIRNRVSSSGVYTSMSPETTNLLTSIYFKFTFFVPVYDSNGNLVSPNFDNDLIQMSTCGVSDGVSVNIFQESHGGSLGSPVDVYLFPSELPVDGGVVNNIITSPTYITELTPSEILGLQQNGFGNLLDTLQSNYNDYYDEYQGSWYTRGLPSIHFLAECQDTYFSHRFDPNSYGLPYALIDHFSSSKIFKINRSDFIGGSRVYAYDHLCILAVCHGENNDTIARYDFTPSLLSDGVTPPSQIHDQSHYIEPSVSDFQALADYLRYVIQVSDNNRDVELRNQIAYLQSIPWSNYVNAGVNSSLNGFLPRLSSEFDTMFNGLFTDFFVPDLEDIEAQIDEDEEAFSDKFQWVHDIKAEVNFIVHTPLAADDDEFVFKAIIQKYSIGEVIFFDSEWIDGSTRIIVKRVITVFCTIALIVYIFKTLPSTLGNMPSD